MMLADTPSVQPDQDVYDAAHEHVGKVQTIGETALHVQSGLFGWVRHHVPFGLISHVDDDGVHLNVTKDQLEDVEEHREETESTVATPDRPSPIEPGGSEVDPRLLAHDRPPATTEGASTVLHEEQLQATTHEVESGEVAIHKDVTEEEQTVTVPVTHEEVHVERRPVDPAMASSTEPIAGEDETVRVPVSHEEVEVTKRTVPTEEVVVEKTPVTETQEVTETVRHEEADVDQDGIRQGGSHWS